MEGLNIYAKWVDGADRADAVSYTVHHAGGSTTMNLNQRINGGAWNFLGRFTMNPASNHRVVVTDSTNGIVVADAVRLVSVTTSGAGLMYVHSDHLGTPQKMTDGSQALVWDAVYKPFGETHSITGTASNNQRFPGQYADSESAFHYNYFRDYDPSTGRYVQSDPIGLVGGNNRYAYGYGNPISLTDYFGLRPLLKCTKDFLQPFFPDLDLDLIDIHPDSIPTELAEAFDFTAITYGNDIYFYGDSYNPYSVDGTALIAHELTHAEQYANASGYDDFLGDYLLEWLENGYDNNAYEQEAKGYESLIESLLNLHGDNPPCKKNKQCPHCPGEEKC